MIITVAVTVITVIVASGVQDFTSIIVIFSCSNNSGRIDNNIFMITVVVIYYDSLWLLPILV